MLSVEQQRGGKSASFFSHQRDRRDQYIFIPAAHENREASGENLQWAGGRGGAGYGRQPL